MAHTVDVSVRPRIDPEVAAALSMLIDSVEVALSNARDVLGLITGGDDTHPPDATADPAA